MFKVKDSEKQSLHSETYFIEGNEESLSNKTQKFPEQQQQKKKNPAPSDSTYLQGWLTD